MHTDFAFSLSILLPPLPNSPLQMCQPCQEEILLLLPTTKTAGLEQKREFSDFSEFLLLLWFPILTH